jgi:predicted metal-dependent phosphoesterase TrpH
VNVTSEGFRVDPHVKVLDETVVTRAKARGLDGLVYAPHFTRLPDISERAEAFSDDGLTVYPARELFTGSWQHRRHVLAIGLEEPVPDFLTLPATISEIDRQDAAAVVPHPGFLNVSLTREEVNTFADRLHAAEVYNPKLLAHHNPRARAIAEAADVPPVATSYAHLRGTVGEVWTEFEDSYGDAGALAAALKEGVPRTVGRRRGFRHQLRCAMEFSHLGYENSWGKIDRLFLQGTEPTHPNHVAYEGRFDDVKVY